jgi:uncharacterized protein (DUF488 family)
MSIFTVGYEGLDIDQFINLLRLSKVDTVVDIRELPLSRKRGFSKNGLREILQANGLGCPKPIRNQYREDGDWSRYKRDFKRYLTNQGAVVTELSEIAQESHCALLCFEANYQMCHRSMVADAVHQNCGLQVNHLQAAPLKTN